MLKCVWGTYIFCLKTTDYILLHVGTNDINRNTSDEIIDELLGLKLHIESTALLSHPIVRADAPRATQTMSDVNKKFNELNTIKMDNSNMQT